MIINNLMSIILRYCTERDIIDLLIIDKLFLKSQLMENLFAGDILQKNNLLIFV